MTMDPHPGPLPGGEGETLRPLPLGEGRGEGLPPAGTRLRVCYVISHFHPRASGAERQALAQGRELVRRGHEARVVTRAIPGLPADDEVGGVRVHRWVRPLPVGPLFGFSFVLGVVRALRKLRPSYDLIHTHQALWEAIATGLGRPWLGGAPTLVQPASSGYYGEAEELSRTRGFPVLRKLTLNNTCFAAISADIEWQWRALGVPAEKVVRMASGVDAEHFRPGPSRLEAALPPRPRVVFTGRLHPQKDLDRLLDAWPAVAARSRASLVFVGDGPDRARLEARARDLGVAGLVHFAGHVADPADYLRAADAFALPSVAEGMSNSLLEAMATGLPCLASAIGGNTDLLADGPAGLLVPADDPDAWPDALLRVLESPDLARDLGAAARRRVEADFALPVVVDRYEALYRRLLGKGEDRSADDADFAERNNP
ncbi:MAG TPA: glycosyltransferase family 4 protein [Isosphaeraceae bacterium]|jgi:glycosyltransferase involved in cell wall biosynthesis|nr:glycosyltransferase family 4 protein [Isosphaeraceae bacterium]